MTFSITLTPQDYVDARRLSLRPRKGLRICLYVLIALVALVVAHDIWKAVTTGEWGESLGWGFFAPVYFAFLYFVALPWRTRRIFKQQKNLQHPVTFTITEQSMRAENLRGQVEMPWSDFHKWKANDKAILLYHSSALFNMIPRRGFANDADFAAVLEIVERNLGKQKS